ncbi:AimR family lysis-lysogeny pheromone receptor [Bacillus paranthracis]|uniref:AimR family lysis-lysogeny pheromone receptor n=1 Tax=Bacillus paranthracis TaxID=2026186 RepID=UPI0024CAAC85|nr:MAG: AimR family lysis-lysogeny pheromone receptor [Bacillus paranthracis]WAI34298.1 MAG: AimR family lysis-lysogeny pheromone receptor [Bacillus paranthracis]WAI37575.1 MAG: AimR family lysis-lysogeny pheromone receptor [Bacillus paranthracis]
MKKLMKRIKKQSDKMELTFPDIERKTGVDRVVITDAVSGKTSEMKFDNFLPVVSVLFENMEERKEIINEFIMLCMGDLNIRKALCYCQGIGEYETIDKIIKKHKNHKKLQKYFKIYQLYNFRNTNKIRGQAMIDKMDEISFSNDSEIQVLVNMLYSFSMYDIFNYRAMLPYTDKVEKNLNELNKGFIKSCLEMHYNDRIAYINLFNEDVKACRKKCEEILNSDIEVPVIKATALCCLGESFLFTDVLKAEKYLLESIKYLDDNGISKNGRKYRSFQSTLAFLYIDNGFNLDKIDFTCIDLSEIAYYEGLYGDKEKALKMFEELSKERKFVSPFIMYYISRINNDILGLKEALKRFERVGNYHYANAVKRVLASIEKRVG